MAKDDELWHYFREVHAAVEAGNNGVDSPPYARGIFMVTARSGEVEVSIKDISEEDAVLIAGELKDLGIKAFVVSTLICAKCHERVAEQAYCTNCRAKLR